MIPKILYTKYHYITNQARKIVPCADVTIDPMSGILSSARVFSLRDKNTKMIKSTIAALAATPLLFSGAAFAGPYVNVEANGSYPDGSYSSGNIEFQIGYEGTTGNGVSWYVSGGPTVQHTETADEFGDVEIAAYLGGSKGITEKVSAYGEIYGATNDDDLDFSGKVGARYAF